MKNLPPNVAPDVLFRLFSLYGNVMKVKIFYKNPENALVEYQDQFQALLAKINLNNCPVFGNNIIVNISKYGYIYPNSKKDDQGYLRDYSNSADHRYKIIGSKNFKHVVPPSRILHLSNISENVDAQYILQLFEQVSKVEGFQYFKNDKKMALVQLSTINDAVTVLTTFHNFDIYGRFLKISFSKNHFHSESPVITGSAPSPVGGAGVLPTI